MLEIVSRSWNSRLNRSFYQAKNDNLGSHWLVQLHFIHMFSFYNIEIR